MLASGYTALANQYPLFLRLRWEKPGSAEYFMSASIASPKVDALPAKLNVGGIEIELPILVEQRMIVR